MLELIYDEELGYKRVVYRPKKAVECANRCLDGVCLNKKLYSKENSIYMDLKCQFKHPNMDNCPDYQPKEKKDNGND